MASRLDWPGIGYAVALLALVLVSGVMGALVALAYVGRL